jgi:hypothetical protein
METARKIQILYSLDHSQCKRLRHQAYQAALTAGSHCMDQRISEAINRLDNFEANALDLDVLRDLAAELRIVLPDVTFGDRQPPDADRQPPSAAERVAALRSEFWQVAGELGVAPPDKQGD